MASGPPAVKSSPPTADLADAVKHWVHFDNLAEALNKQVANARTMRATFETKILTMLEVSGMPNAVLKITGATLQRHSSFKPADLSWTMLEKNLHDYYKLKGKPDETVAILDFIKKNRGGKTVECLEKKTADAAVKKPPSSS